MHMILRLKPKNNNLKGKFLEMSTFGCYFARTDYRMIYIMKK